MLFKSCVTIRVAISLYYVGVAVGTPVPCMGGSLINRKLYLVAEMSAGCNRGLESEAHQIIQAFHSLVRIAAL